MADWNPNDTGTLGLEWQPIGGGAIPLDSFSKMVATSFEQTVSQAIGAIQVPNTGFPVRGGIYAVEVYDNETAVPVDSPTTLIAVPNEDVLDGAWLNTAGNNVTMSAYIDEGTTPDTSDDIHMSGVGSQVTMRLNTGTLSLTGKRILSVRMRVYSAIGPTGWLNYGLHLGATDYWSGQNSYGPQTARWFSTTWTYNPATKKPWTIADIQALDTTDEFFIGGQTQAGVWSAVVVYSVVLEVVVCTENRLAVGGLDDTGGALTAGTSFTPAWNSATVVTPTGGTWTKDGAGRHLYTVRRISSNGSMNSPFLDQLGGAPPVFPLFRSWSPRVDAQYGIALNMNSEITRLHSWIQRTTAPADSVDSLPYVKATAAGVYSGRVAESEFSGAAATVYGLLRFWVYRPPGSPAALNVKIKRRSDNVQLGGTFGLTPDIFDEVAIKTSGTLAAGYGWGQVQVQLPSNATLAAATQYYVEFSSTLAPVSGQPVWNVLAVETMGNGNTATYNGTTDAATINGAAENLGADLLVTVATVPAAPASMTAALGSQSVDETVNCVTAIPRADLSWAPTALVASFGRYEIQRSEDGGTTWADIAWVLSESVTTWKDYEALRGIQATYRVRVVRSDGAASAYVAAPAGVTKPLMAGTGAYAATMYLVSNFDPTQNLAYEYRPTKDYTFNEAEEQTRQGVYGRDFQLGANPLENRGVTARWTFIIGVDDKVPVGGGLGWNAYTPLRELARAALPYVCMLDHHGNRLLSALRVPNGNQDTSRMAELYLADVIADQVDDDPYVVAVVA